MTSNRPYNWAEMTCDHCGAETEDLTRIYVRDAHACEHFPISAEDGYYHLCDDCAEQYGCNAYDGMSRGEVWDAFMGGCTPRRFCEESDFDSIEDAVSSYLDEWHRLAGLPADEDLTDEERRTVARDLGNYINNAVEQSVPEGWALCSADLLADVSVETAATTPDAAEVMDAVRSVPDAVVRWHRSEHRVVAARKLWGVRWIVNVRADHAE